MSHIATSEDPPRPSIGRPRDNPHDKPKRRIGIQHRRNGTVLKARVREAMAEAMNDLKKRLETSTGLDFSHALIVRRSVDMYLKHVAGFSEDQLKMEADIIKHQHR